MFEDVLKTNSNILGGYGESYATLKLMFIQILKLESFSNKY